MSENISHIVPVLSTSDLERDIVWYEKYVGFKLNYLEDGYAVLKRDDFTLHLQFHYGDQEDPVYGSVVKFFVKDIHLILKEMVERGTVSKEKLRLNTPWRTHEFGFYDHNKNALFFVQDN
ncbi:MAG: VOC family protein [bacterium]